MTLSAYSTQSAHSANDGHTQNMTRPSQHCSQHLYRREMQADLDTPVSAYLKLAHQEQWSFLYESVEGNEVWASYSILGFGAARTLIAKNGILTVNCTDRNGDGDGDGNGKWQQQKRK